MTKRSTIDRALVALAKEFNGYEEGDDGERSLFVRLPDHKSDAQYATAHYVIRLTATEGVDFSSLAYMFTQYIDALMMSDLHECHNEAPK